MNRFILLIIALTLSACSQDTGTNNSGNECNSTAVEKPYSLFPTNPEIAYRYLDKDTTIETNTRFKCAKAIFNGEKRVVLYPTEREVEIKASPRNLAFTLRELISTSNGDQGGTIKLHGYEIENFPMRVLVPDSTRLVDFNIVFSRSVTLYNQFLEANVLQTLDFGDARIVFPNFNEKDLTGLMIELAPLLVSPATLSQAQIGFLKDLEIVASAFLGFINADKNGLVIDLKGSTNFLGNIDKVIKNRTEFGKEIETKFRLIIGSDLPEGGIPLLADVKSIKLVADVTIAQVLVPKVGAVTRQVRFSIEGLENSFTINEDLRQVTKGDNDNDFAVFASDVEAGIYDSSPNDPNVQ